MPALSERYWTAADVRELPDDGNRYECIDGVLLVTPSPRPLHQRALMHLVGRLLPYVSSQGVGELLSSPADLELETDTLVQPDLFVVPPTSNATAFTRWSEVTGLRLAVEILSPSTARHDRVTKREFYRRTGVEEYWIVDLDARVVERWTPASDRPEIHAERLAWHPSGAPEALSLELGPLFRAILGD